MSLLFGCASPAPAPPVVLGAMAEALRAHPDEEATLHALPGLSLGVLGGEPAERAPTVSADGRARLWLAGEIFDAGPLGTSDLHGRRSPELRTRVLAALRDGREDVLRALDGEFQLAFWSVDTQRLILANDRFASLPLYWATPDASRFVFAGGVRGVLMAPGVGADPDVEALQEAVSFGGFRLADRTQIASVKMIGGGRVVRVDAGAPSFRRYWSWGDIPARAAQPRAAAIDEARALWTRAIGRRLAGAERPGQTLSGGLDSRAILAEGAPRSSSWTAITYGLPGCDDGRYAQQAARIAGADWRFHELYGGADPDWLERRSASIQATDGLVDLTDLGHLETRPLQAELMDVHLSGYIGDAVAGPSFNEVTDAEGVLRRLPYYGGVLGMPADAALARAEQLLGALAGAPARFALFEHKLPQSTNRWSAAWRPWFRVRRPFTDYAFFDFFQGQESHVRGRDALYAHFLRATYPAFFAGIPNQKTGLPVLASPARLFLERGRRALWRRSQPALAALGLPARPRVRAYTDDEGVWRRPATRERITETILRPGSLAVDVFGRERVAGVLEAWFERAAAPTQVIGALYVGEHYRAGLHAHLQHARARAAR